MFLPFAGCIGLLLAKKEVMDFCYTWAWRLSMRSVLCLYIEIIFASEDGLKQLSE